jgi:Uma2 family endonuclease
MPDRKNYELVDGHLVELNVRQLSSWVGSRLHYMVQGFLESHGLGWAWYADLGYACFPDSPQKVRKPDVSFVRNERLPEGPTSEGYMYIAPDLAVEVVSHNDLASEIEAKVVEYLDAGVRLVWVIDPETRTARVHRANGSVSWLREKDDLSGEDVLPGFQCRLGELFPKRGAEVLPSR